MNAVVAALSELQQKLTDGLPETPGTRIFTVPLALSDASDALGWLAAQPVWPQFYWQQRDGEQELAALGAVQHFTDLPQGRAWLAGQPDSGHLLVCGLNQFDPASGALFLPRLLWQRQRGHATLTLLLHSDHSLADDALRARAMLAGLQPAQPLPLRQLTLLREQQTPSEPHWHQLIHQALACFARGTLDKVVLARASDLWFSEAVPAANVLAASRRVNMNCYHFYMAFEAGRAFIGSSPERLWRRRGNQLRTEALAGTVANSPDDAQAARQGAWLMHDDKNQRENMLVVEDICLRLKEIANTLDVLPAQVMQLRKVQHLRRCIWTTLHQPDDALCLQQLQPTAAVAGLPREDARAFIAHCEPFERQWYAGSAGYLTRQQAEFCVSLRSALVEDNRVRLYAGAGIVPGSDPAEEWREINNKAAGLRSLLTEKSE
ncbi:isochorismate synthase MenF [Shimwellia pseudoproteus]|uniref:isochorismate synthase MenF n=1 Tax=Shimwellia pseudoproteus TaxID=570012 RepID=UPI0018EAE0AC|nr:isochorismate synthase MenF [Shimwellia pseudoproteus]